LYVAGEDRVVAFPLSASGAATPLRTLFVHRLQQDGIVGIATNADTSLDVLQNFRNSPTGPGTPMAAGNFPDCRVVVYAASASGDSAALSQYACFHATVGPSQAIAGARGIGIARGSAALGAIDYLEAALPAASPSPGDFVQRSNEAGADNGLLVISEPQAKVHNGIAEGSTGIVYITSNPTSGGAVPKGASSDKRISSASTNPCLGGSPNTAAQVDYYAPGAINNSSPNTFVISGRVTAGAIAAYPVTDPFKRVYVATCDGNGSGWVDEVVTQNFPVGTVSPNRSIGPFTQSSVTALAVDAQGNIYVGLTDNPNQFLLAPAGGAGGNAVRVYGPGFANGTKRPDHSIEGPLPPLVNGNQKITGLAITQ